MSTADAQWLQQSLSTLLSSPHISIPAHGPGGLRMGPGPIDLFSTRFNNLFAADAAGSVAGAPVDRAGLKGALLALQKRWNPDSASFTAQDAQAPQVATRFAWTQSGGGTQAEVTASASVEEEGGSTRIKTLDLDGDASLFEQ